MLFVPKSRRLFLGSSALGVAMLTQKGLFAEQLLATPAMTEGPFYPDKMPLDTDNDLLVLSDSLTPAAGTVTYLGGRVLTKAGSPVRNALVEIWQCDQNGAYLHTQSGNADNRDKHFQGYGRFLTDGEGRYFFRTIRPVPYPGRTPHIHFAVSQNGHRKLTTQMLIEGEAQNERDGVYRNLKTEQEKKSVLAAFVPLPDSKLGELTAKWDIVLGLTPEDESHAS